MYYKGRGDNIGRLLELIHLQQKLRYIGYHNLALPSYETLVQEVDNEIEMLKCGDHSHV